MMKSYTLMLFACLCLMQIFSATVSAQGFNPSLVTCRGWAVQNRWPHRNPCPRGKTLTTYVDIDAVTCDSSKRKTCKNTCCMTSKKKDFPTPEPKPRPTPSPKKQACYVWSRPYGGPYNACGDGMVYIAQDGDMCRADGADCFNRCCDYLLY